MLELWWLYMLGGILIATAFRAALAALWRGLSMAAPVGAVVLALWLALRVGDLIPIELIPALPGLALVALLPAGAIYALGWNGHVSYREELDVLKARDLAAKERR